MQPQNSGYGAIAASGGTLLIENATCAEDCAFEEYFTGTAPSTCSVTIQGQMHGGTKDTAANTNSTVAASIIGITFTKPYGGFLVTATWTGGDTTTMFNISWTMGLN